ncbi:MAG: glycosyltransferase [Flavobacteriales bacterium]|nr:glycosyltransferase [Flavobacteriales bacterium]MCW8937705.1 glycosyltransferase [Flavobacteriales bacterium]MCW8968578.1 glycosyltransferase [Flavobacteriales bacterium]MCW8990193.1 glycosyltransferase [Flavobacteriales bacterium]MCW9019911.1 glycosyltransferase [Flavobacteriales bacterium]
MKIYQCIHKYPPHIPLFEKMHGINDSSTLTFEALRKLLVNDGYAASYILKPALEHKTNEVFFTIWNYERLQLLWAKENGLTTTDLTEIKLAQIKKFKPDVFYNMSPFADDNFIELLIQSGVKTYNICWNGFIEKRPRTFPFYDIHLTLHQPFVNYWKKLGLKANELQPAVIDKWLNNPQEKTIDVLFYGQYYKGIFNKRNELINQLMLYSKSSPYLINVHLQVQEIKRLILKLPKINIQQTVFPSKKIRKLILPPLYGQELSNTLKKSKIVVNAYGDNNQDYKSNMRLFEAIGHGALLISERGNYPEGLIPDEDFITYSDYNELESVIEKVLMNWDDYKEFAERASKKIHTLFSKENQWKKFQEIVGAL